MPPEEADLNVARRDGRERWKHLNALPIKQIHDRLISQYDGHALSIIDRLMSDLEG
ncbi:ArsR family transcriptional regulator [Mesorhizobium sp. LNHC209A00]|nr:ArsR family transcriptional regulator [Mesorhizobium sp. LNHC209A00]